MYVTTRFYIHFGFLLSVQKRFFFSTLSIQLCLFKCREILFSPVPLTVPDFVFTTIVRIDDQNDLVKHCTLIVSGIKMIHVGSRKNPLTIKKDSVPEGG